MQRRNEDQEEQQRLCLLPRSFRTPREVERLTNMLLEYRFQRDNHNDLSSQEVAEITEQFERMQEQERRSNPVISQTSQCLFSSNQIPAHIHSEKSNDERFEELCEQLESFSTEDINNEIACKRLQERLEEFKQKYTCSLSRAIFQEPVIVSSGHSFEKDSIKMHVQKNNNEARCPVITTQILDPKIMIPNYQLKSNISFELEKLENQVAILLKDNIKNKVSEKTLN